MALTDRQCRGFTPTDKMQKYADRDGLVFVVMPTGRKVWRGRYRLNGKEQTKTLGEYPQVSLAQARKLWYDFKNDDSSTKSPTFAAVYESIPAWRERRGLRVDKNFPASYKKFPDTLRNKPIDSITRRDLVEFVDHIARTDTKSSPIRVLRVINDVFNLAEDLGYIETNPAHRLHRIAPAVVTEPRESLPLDKLGWYINLIHAHTTYHVDLRMQLFFKMGLLTAVRLTELSKMRWDQVDFDAKLWTIPGHQMKKKRDHLVPLSSYALAILRYIQKTACFEEVFRGGKQLGLPSISWTSYIHTDVLGLRGLHTFHGNRAAFATGAQELFDAPFDVVRVQLSHIPPGTTRQAYDRALFLEKRTKLMQQWGDWLNEQALCASNSLGGLLYPLEKPKKPT